MLQILKPLEVRHSDATPIAKHIRKEADASPQENVLSCPRGRSIGSLNYQLTVELLSIILVD